MNTDMYTLDPEKRVKNFKEVCRGYSREQLIDEAEALLKERLEQPATCPFAIDLAQLLELVKQDDYEGALALILEQNPFPGISGRLCSSHPGAAIGHVQRYVADRASLIPKRLKQNKRKVAVVGSGPSGMTCAATLAARGYHVDMFEALHEVGGRLSYSVPSFKLPREVMHDETELLLEMGVEIHKNCLVGRTLPLGDLQESHDAIFLAVGVGPPQFLGIAGEKLKGVCPAREFLMRVNLMKDKTHFKAESTVVVGGGEEAVDAARIAVRLGNRVTVVYRGSIEEMKVGMEDIVYAQEEGVTFLTLTHPSRIIGNRQVTSIECMQMMLDEGSTVPIEDSEFRIDCDQVIIVGGFNSNPLVNSVPGLRTYEDGRVMTDDFQRTSVKGIFAGGRMVSPESNVVDAITEGRKAALAIDEYLSR